MISIPRSEDDYRTELITEINARLPKPYKAYNSKTVTFDKDDPRVAVLKASKREFDIIIVDKDYVSESETNTDRIEFAVETKPLGSNLSGISQAEDAFTAFPNLKITYATNFGNELYKREKDNPETRLKTPAKILAKRIIQIAEYITSDVKRLKDIKPTRGEVSEKEIIATLIDCMDRIHSQMTELQIENQSDLATRTLVMWKKYDDDDIDVSALEYNVKRAASYIVVDQLMFYNLLQKKTTKYRLPPLEPINGNEDNPKMFSTKYIERAISDTGDYLPIFGIDMFELLPSSKNVIKAINDVIIKISDLKIETQSSDFIGKIFHSMIPSEIRKSLAAYYTGSAPAKLLALLTIKKETDKVCDLACGSGTLLIESYHVLYDLYKSNNTDMTDEKIHKQLIESQIYGNDITLFASHLAAMNLASQCLDGEITRINITATDGLKISPRQSYSSIIDFVKSTVVQTVNMDGRTHSIAYPSVNCVIMNPPFSRQTDMTEAVINNLNKAFIEWFPSKNDQNKYIDKKMGLHGYFLIHADHLIKKNGRIAMVLPTSTFTTDYTGKLLQFLSDKLYSIDYVIEILSKRSAFSEDATFKEYMVVFRKGSFKTDSKTLIISINDEFSLDDVNQLYDIIKNNKKSDLLSLKTVNTQELYDSTKWTEIFTEQIDFAFLKSPKLEKLSRNTSDFHLTRGFDATYSDYLILPNKEWNIEKINITTFRLIHTNIPKDDEQYECQIPATYLIPAIRWSKDANTFMTSPSSYVLNLPYDFPRDLDEFRRKYLHWAKNELDIKWEHARKKGHKRVPIVKRATFKKNRNGERVIDAVPWYSHAYKNKCYEKKGNIFFLKKYRPTKRRSLSFYTNDIASVNHGLFFLKDNYNKLIASWLASSLYLISHFKVQQIISLNYYKMAIQDFSEVLFPKLSKYSIKIGESLESTNEAKDLIAKWKTLAKLPDEDVPFLPQQLGADLVVKSKKRKDPPPDQVKSYERLPERVELDKAWLRVLGVSDDKIDETINEIYNWLIDYMETR